MELRHFDLNLLRSLDALLTERNVTRAAERLFVTQQAMSGTLGRLRAHFDDPLLVRVGRHLEPTPLARSLVLPIREALLKVYSALGTHPHFDPKAEGHIFKIAMTDYASLVLLPKLLRRLAQEAPYVQCHVEELTALSFQQIELGELDFCITASNPRLYGPHRAGPDVRSDHLFSDDFVCIMDRNHPSACGPLTVETYRCGQHNSVRFGRDIATLVEQAWLRAGIDINVAAIAPSFSVQIFMLPGTALLATVQRRLAEMLQRPLALHVEECPIAVEPLHEHLFWHRRYDADPKYQYFRDAVMISAQSLT